MDVPAGQLTFLGVTKKGSDQLVKSGDGTLVVTRVNTHSGGTFVQAGTLFVHSAGGLGTGPLEIDSGATVILDVDYSPIPLASLSVAALGTLDIGTASLVVRPGGYDLAEIRSLLDSARGSGGWTGPGITSRSVQGVPFHEVGYRVLPDGSLEIGVAAPGDANMDGEVNSLDLVALNAAGAYGTATSAGWWQGDFNYDGRVSIADLILLNAAGLYGSGGYLTDGRPTLPDLSGTATVEPAATLVGITLTGTAATISEPAPVGEPVSSPSTPRAARRTQPRRIDQFAWLAQAEQDQGVVSRDRKAAWWRQVARG